VARSKFEEREEAKRALIERALFYARITAGLYLLFVIAVPIIAWALVLITGKNTVVYNIDNLYSMMANFMRAVAQITPGDYILGAVVVLYNKRFKPSLVFLAGAAFLYLFGTYCADGVTAAVKSMGLQSPGSLVLECLYTGLSFGILLTSLFVPTMVAYERKKPTWKRYLLLNILLGWIPPAWVALVFFAFKKPKNEIDPPKPEPEVKPVPKHVHKRELKKKKGFKKK